MTTRIRIGILGAAGIAPRAMIGPARRRDDADVVAVAARSAERANAYASRHGIPAAYGDYRRVIEDPSIDLVYVALAPSEHARWSLAALEAGKDVLCEKPFAMTAAEAAEVVGVARRAGRRAFEAFHDEHHPLWARTREIAAQLGPIRRVEGEFLVNNPYEPGAIRHEPELGGGALMDLGCYPLHWVRSLVGEEPTVASAGFEPNPAGVDDSITAEMTFPSGVTARIDASMRHDGFDDRRRVVGERGTLEEGGVVFPSRGHSLTWTLDGVDFQETVGGRQSYDHQLEAVLQAIRSGDPLSTEGDDIIANMRAIEEIYRVAGVR
ncbi:MAG TPA: Gfo/Idh/MocA family oxidoreductase [Microbacterium sp.]|nr:Gfo/Idh/MocA family oxidoreductase [Microbacterium sp.]